MSESEHNRYLRQLKLPDFGEVAQEKLGRSTILVAGLGGLGSPVSIYLAAAGIGKMILCDHDTVVLTNLNRQILHGTSDIGSGKTLSAAEFITDLNPSIEIEVFSNELNSDSLQEIGREVDIIADCLDNVATRMALNHFCIENRIPVVHGGIEGWSGQVTTILPPGTPCMNCLFSDARDTGEVKPVLGAVAGIIGTTQALEIIHIATGRKETLKNKLMHFDGQTMEWTRLKIERNEECSVCSKLY